jgi:hypothetical protein
LPLADEALRFGVSWRDISTYVLYLGRQCGIGHHIQVQPRQSLHNHPSGMNSDYMATMVGLQGAHVTEKELKPRKNTDRKEIE